MDEKLRQEKECWIFMWIFKQVSLPKSDKLVGWTVLTRMLIPTILAALTLIWIVLKLLCCILCSKAKTADKEKTN
jgi:hypothetical protein